MCAEKTIVAIATPPGKGGVGIVRISGPQVKAISQSLLGIVPSPRCALLRAFKDAQGQVLDQGLVLYFPAPHSFTGEDVLELQGHGGPIILDLLLQQILTHENVRMAEPGEFSKRAFLNGKLDLTQAEAIADLINASSDQAARGALRSLQGEFSKKIQQLVKAVIELRVYVEAAIDFPEEEIDFLSDGKVSGDLQRIIDSLVQLKLAAQQGTLLQEGMSVVIAGEPNAGKSSLLNALSGQDRAIVTDVAGTTRDVLREFIHIDGMPLHVIDTAGLRESTDVAEQEGVRRAWGEIAKADLVLLVVDLQKNKETRLEKLMPAFCQQQEINVPVVVVRNKIDTLNKPASISNEEPVFIELSAKTSAGLDLLRQYLKDFMGYSDRSEGVFMARRRHLDALDRAEHGLAKGLSQLQEHQAGELLAEDLRQVQQALNEITGEFSNEDLLGAIFSSFCIGK